MKSRRMSTALGETAATNDANNRGQRKGKTRSIHKDKRKVKSVFAEGKDGFGQTTVKVVPTA